MQELRLLQGTDEWKSARKNYFTASEAPQMMGASKLRSRDKLLFTKSTGIEEEHDAETLKRFARGHAAEAGARPIISEIYGDDFFPKVGVAEIDGLQLLASFDGLTMDCDVVLEHKLFNQELSVSVPAGEISPYYYWQLEQQLLISGAEKALFVASNGTADQFVYMTYYPVAGRREALVAGWKQFAIDLANYVMPEAEAAKAIAEPVETLPAITYSTDFKSTGLELRSNIEAFKAAAQRLVEKSKKQLESDQDFANAEARIKSCKAAEEKIAVIQSNVVGEVSDIDKFVKDLGTISEMLRQCRLNEDKQVKARKEAIKLEELNRASIEWGTVIINYDEKLWKIGKVKMPTVTIDLHGAIKGLKTVGSLRSRLNDEIARGKIEAAAIYEKIVFNIDLLSMHAGEYGFLFSDIQNLVLKDSDYVTAIAQQRVSEHKAAEHDRIQAEAQRIANEQIERDRQAEQARRQAKHEAAERAKAQAAALEAVKQLEAEVAPIRETRNDLIESIPADYEQYSAQSPSLEQSFDAVFSEPEPLLDMSDFLAGKAAAFEAIADLYFECKNSGKDFGQEFIALYQRNKLPKKAA